MSLLRKVVRRNALIILSPPSLGTLILVPVVGLSSAMFFPFFAFWIFVLVPQATDSISHFFLLGIKIVLMVGIYTAPCISYLLTGTQPRILYGICGVLSVSQAIMGTLAVLTIDV